MSETFVLDTDECLGPRTRFVDAPVEGVDWIVTVSYYNLIKFFYFVPILRDVTFGFSKGKMCVFILLQFYMENCTRYLF